MGDVIELTSKKLGPRPVSAATDRCREGPRGFGLGAAPMVRGREWHSHRQRASSPFGTPPASDSGI